MQIAPNKPQLKKPSKATAAKAGAKGATKATKAGAKGATKLTKTGAKGATKVARSRSARRAAKPAVKATWFVGKKVAKRKAKKHARRYAGAAGQHAQRYAGAAGTAWSAARIYGPMAAEVFGLAEQPKRRPVVPAFLAGIAAGAGAMYLATRSRASGT